MLDDILYDATTKRWLNVRVNSQSRMVVFTYPELTVIHSPGLLLSLINPDKPQMHGNVVDSLFFYTVNTKHTTAAVEIPTMPTVNDTWFVQRKEITDFRVDLSVETTIEDRRDRAAIKQEMQKILLDFKCFMNSKEDYLACLEFLFQNKPLSEHLQYQHGYHLVNIQVTLQERYTDYVPYMLACIKSEYEAVSGDKYNALAKPELLSQALDADHLGSDTLHIAFSLYHALFKPNFTSIDVVDVLKILAFLQKPDGTHELKYRLIGEWLSEIYDVIGMRFLCFKKIFFNLYDGDGNLRRLFLDVIKSKQPYEISENASETLRQYAIKLKVGSRDASKTLAKYPEFRTLFDRAAAIEFFDTVDGRIQSKVQLYGMAFAHEEIVLRLLDKPETLLQLLGDQLAELAKKYPAFIPEILKRPAIFYKLDGDQLGELARNNLAFALRLLDERDALMRLEGYQLPWISEAYPIFVAQLTDKPAMMVLDADQLIGIARANQEFGLFLLGNSELLEKKFNEEQLSRLLTALTMKPEVLAALSVDQMSVIANAYGHFSTQLQKKSELLVTLSDDQLCGLACVDAEFALCLLGKSNLLAKLNGAQLCAVASAHPAFALGLLDRLNLFDKFKEDLFKFALQLLDKPKILSTSSFTQLREMTNVLDSNPIAKIFNVLMLAKCPWAKKSYHNFIDSTRGLKETILTIFHKLVRDDTIFPAATRFFSGHPLRSQMGDAQEIIKNLESLPSAITKEDVVQILLPFFRNPTTWAVDKWSGFQHQFIYCFQLMFIDYPLQQEQALNVTNELPRQKC